MGLTKRDEISIDEIFSPKDSGLCPETILKQDFAIAENYRQITTEKIVINGFVFASILFSAVALDGESRKPKICQHNQRIEFTQFVPIEKEHREKTWSAVRTGFTGKNLNVSIGYDEENPEGAHFHLTGDVDTQVELFESRQRDMVVDAYHREKNFACQSATARLFNLSDGATAEVSIREIITLPEGSKATEAVYGSGNISECQALPEKGRVVVTGMISAGALWKGQDEGFRTEKITTDFRSSVDMDGALPQQKVTVNPLIKTVSAELINDKQIELSASLLIGVETYSEEELTLIENPHFDEQSARQEYPMVIAVMKEGESLWDLAKRYRTTENHIRLANKLESEPKAGRRLLIVK